MLSTLASMFGGEIINQLFGTFGDIVKRYQDRQISEVEAKQAMVVAMVAAFRDVEVAHADAITKTYASFMGAVEKSRLMQIGWAVALFSQIFVLVWYQWLVPLLCYFEHNKSCYPSAGSTIDWAYFLIGGLVGLAPAVLRGGPAAGNPAAGFFKSMLGK